MVLDKNSPVPLYHQLKLHLEELIQNDYNPGELFLSDLEISKAFNVSRVTVRKSVAELEKSNLLERSENGEIYIKRNIIERTTDKLLSWTQEMKILGYKPKLLKIEEHSFVADAKTARIFGIEEGSQLKEICRIKNINDMGNFIFTTVLNPKYIDSIDLKDLDNNSLYDLLNERYAFEISSAEEIIEAKIADEELAKALDMNIGEPVLSITRISYLRNNHALVIGNTLAKATTYQYRAKLFINS